MGWLSLSAAGGAYHPIARLQIHKLDGAFVGEGFFANLTVDTADAEKREQIIAVTGNRAFPFSYAGTFNIFGDSIYIRSSDYLYCVRAR